MAKTSKKKRDARKRRARAARPAPRPPATGSPGGDLPELQKARGLWQNERYDEALACFDEAVDKAPDSPIALIDAARAFGARFEVARAEELLDRLMALAGDRADVLHLAGQSYRMVFRPRKAVECFERAVAASGDLPDAHLELAILLERRHRLEEARTHIDACLRRKPGYPEADVVRARLLRRTGQVDAAENSLRDLTRAAGVHWLVRSRAWAELAQMLDERGDYDDAFGAMGRCKRILLARSADLWDQSRRETADLRVLTDSFTAAHLGRWASQCGEMPKREMAFLTGAPRSGTTLLDRVLDSHPQVVSSDERGMFPRYIFPSLLPRGGGPRALRADLLDAVGPGRLLAQRDRYVRYAEEALGEPIGDRVHVDKNPSIVRLIPGILRLYPECKLLIALRDPRDVITSCFMRHLPLNTVSVSLLTLKRAARRYAEDMDAWLKFREMIPDAWLEVRYEDTVGDLEGQARRAVAFLGLGWRDEVLAYRDRGKDKAVNSPTYEAVAKPVYTSAIGRWRNYERPLAPVLDALQPYVAAFGYDAGTPHEPTGKER